MLSLFETQMIRGLMDTVLSMWGEFMMVLPLRGY